MKIIHRLLAAAAMALTLPVLAADPIAFITNLKGEVAVDGNARPQLLSELARGQKISVGANAMLAVMYVASGTEYVLDGPGSFEVKDTEVAGSGAARPAVRATSWRTSAQAVVQVGQSAAASVRMRSLAKAREETALVYPTEGRVATLQPTFRWRAPDAKKPGEIAVQQVGEEKPLHTARVAGGSYRLPARLKPDTEYAWSYAIDGSEVGSGRFRTLSSEGLQRIEKARPAANAGFSDRVMFAVMLQEVGATQEAREVWARLAEERADLGELAALARR